MYLTAVVCYTMDRQCLLLLVLFKHSGTCASLALVLSMGSASRQVLSINAWVHCICMTIFKLVVQLEVYHHSVCSCVFALAAAINYYSLGPIKTA